MGFIRQRGSSDMRDLNTNSGNWAIVKVGVQLLSNYWGWMYAFTHEHLELETVLYICVKVIISGWELTDKG